MKKLILISILLLSTSILFSQKRGEVILDEVHLKVGKVLKGKVLETKPDEYIIFQPNTKDADELYIEMGDIIKIVEVTEEVKEKKRSVFYANYTYLSYKNNRTTKDTTSSLGVNITNGVLFQTGPNFGIELGVGLGYHKGSRVTSVPIFFLLKFNKTISDKIVGLFELEPGLHINSYKNQYKNHTDLQARFGFGAKYKYSDKLSFYSSLGFTYEEIQTPRTKEYYSNDIITSSSTQLEYISPFYLQLNFGINF